MANQSILKLKAVNQFNILATDRGSEANDDISFWTPDLPNPAPQYYYLGCYATNNYNNPASPSGPQYVVTEEYIEFGGDDSYFKAPIGFSLTWSCIGNDQASNLGIYSLVAPDGYIGLGSVAAMDFNNPPNVSDFPFLVCVREDLCEKVTVNQENFIWCDKGSGAPLDVTVWMLPNSQTCCAVTYDGYPDSELVFDLKPEFKAVLMKS